MSEFREGQPGLSVRELPETEWSCSPWGDLEDEFNEDAKNAFEEKFLEIKRDEEGNIKKIIITSEGEKELARRATRSKEVREGLIKMINIGEEKAKTKENGKNEYKEKSPTALLGRLDFLKNRYLGERGALIIYKDEKRDVEEVVFQGSKKQIMEKLLEYLEKVYNYKP